MTFSAICLTVRVWSAVISGRIMFGQMLGLQQKDHIRSKHINKCVFYIRNKYITMHFAFYKSVEIRVFFGWLISRRGTQKVVAMFLKNKWVFFFT